MQETICLPYIELRKVRDSVHLYDDVDERVRQLAYGSRMASKRRNSIPVSRRRAKPAMQILCALLGLTASSANCYC